MFEEEAAVPLLGVGQNTGEGGERDSTSQVTRGERGVTGSSAVV